MSSRVADPVHVPQPNGHGSADPPPTPGRPFLPVALALLSVVVLVLAGAFLLDRQFRKPVGVEPAPPVAAKAPPIAAARTAPALAEPTAVPTATTAPTATAMPTLPPAPVGAAAPPPQPTPTVDPLQQEIAEAYLRYWQVRKEAYLKMDPALLEQVMADPKLGREREYMEELRAEGHGARIDVQHKFVVVKASPDEAMLFDEYQNNSPLIDLATGKEIPLDSPPSTWKVSVVLKKIDGVWKVVDGARYD